MRQIDAMVSACIVDNPRLSGRLSAAIASHVVTFDATALSSETIHAAQRALLDGMGVMIAASGTSPEVKPFVEYATSWGGGCAAILGTGLSAPPPLAALANGAMAHALDFEDAFDRAPCHPNASLLPAVFAALSLAAKPISGRSLLAAIATGCDLVCRMTLALRRPLEAGGWYPPPILGGFGAVAGAARILDLNEQEFLDASSLLMCQSSTPAEIKFDEHTVLRAVREALPAEAAVRAAILARSGVRGFARPLEGEGGFYRAFALGEFEPSDITDGLGSKFWIDDLSFKKWPTCRGTHAFIECAQLLRDEHGFRPEDIRSIRATGGNLQTMLAEPIDRKQAPSVAIDAKFSIPFAVAAAIVAPEVTLESFAPRALVDSSIRTIAKKVSFERFLGAEADHPTAGALAITLEDGSVHTRKIDVPAGHYSRPLSDAELQKKFVACLACAARPVPKREANALADVVWRLDGSPNAMTALADAIGPGP